MKIGDLLNSLAGKLNLQNNKELIDVLSRADMQQIDIPDAFANQLASDLMSLEGAKNNSKVKGHYTALALNGVDTELANAVTEFNLDGTLFDSEKDTYGKLRTLKAKLKELMEKKPEKNGEAEKEYNELKKKYNELNQKLAETLENNKKDVAAIKDESNNQVLSFLKSHKLAGLNYADKDRPVEVQAKLAQILIDEAMTKDGAKLINDGGSLKLKSASDVSLDYFDISHKQVSYDDYVKKVLADNKMLTVSDPKPGNIPPPAQQQGVFSTASGQQQINRSSFDAAIAASLGDVNQKS